jgi:hypothetical protein
MLKPGFKKVAGGLQSTQARRNSCASVSKRSMTVAEQHQIKSPKIVGGIQRRPLIPQPFRAGLTFGTDRAHG